MLIGHYGASLAAKKLAPAVPLWLLCLAAQFVDIVWALLILLRIEHARLDPELLSVPLDLYFMPYSHSLLGTAFWVLLAMILSLAVRAVDLKGALVVGAVVLSHWFFDLLVHRPDLSLLGGDHKVGLALWDHPVMAVAVELFLFLGAFAWLRATDSAAWLRHPALLLAIGVLALMTVGVGLGWLPSPDKLSAIILFQLALYALVPLGAWWLEKR